MLVLGLNCMHDAAAALVLDGQVVAAAEEERFTRVKHTSGFPARAIRYCLDSIGGKIGDIDHVAVGWKYWVLGRRALHAVQALAASPRMFAAKAQRGIGQMQNEWRQLFQVRRLLERHFGPGRYSMTYLDHHFCHAVSTFYVSPFDAAAILTLDGAGEETTTMAAVGEGLRIRVLQEIKLPHSLGQFYSAVTGFLGFRMTHDEYKVMGLAPYGQPRHADFILRNILRTRADGGFRLDYRFLDYHLARRGVFLPEAIRVFGPPCPAGSPVQENHKDLAASAQAALEEVILHLTRTLHARTGLPNLCLAGGVAFNCVANARIRRDSSFKQIFVQPAAGDAGTALGAALALYHQKTGRERDFQMTHAYLGPTFPKAACRQVLEAARVPFREYPEDALCQEVAGLLAEGNVVGWFQGRMEWGPRALGSRSLLADPRRSEMRDIINIKVKRREEFRPFAPSVPLEDAGAYFEDMHESPYMLFVFNVRPEMRTCIPAVTHVDGSARPQTVRRDANPRFWHLLREFGRLTGVPVLLNTSFNVQEPIVCTPEDAMHCFLQSGIDYLVLDDFLASRPVE